MAILCSQELLNFAIEHFSLFRFKSHTKRSWQALFLGIDFAFEYPVVFTSLPSIPQTPSRTIWSPIPEPIGLLFQIAVFLLIENFCLLILPAFEPSQEKEFTAARHLSTEFLAPRITLLLGIPLLESILLGKVVEGQLHFAAVVGWLTFRHLFVRSRL